MIKASREFNISVLDITAPFSVFERYGFSSGRDGSKFGGVNFKRSTNGLIYLPDNTAAFLSCRTESETDLGTHTLFIAEVTDGGVLSAEQPMTYAYYHANVKPKPAETKSGKNRLEMQDMRIYNTRAKFCRTILYVRCASIRQAILKRSNTEYGKNPAALTLPGFLTFFTALL